MAEIATKEQERKALAQIRKIVEGLGPQSYIGTAMTGVWKLADQNIDLDAAFNFQEENDLLRKQLTAAENERDTCEETIKALTKENQVLMVALDAEQEWKPCDGGTNLAQDRYEELAKAGGTEIMTEQKAKEILADEFGFDPAKIAILDKACTYEANRHNRMRAANEYERAPVYNATDWNYIRFDCAHWMYEMINGQLHSYNC